LFGDNTASLVKSSHVSSSRVRSTQVKEIMNEIILNRNLGKSRQVHSCLVWSSRVNASQGIRKEKL
jgi:hypothetical protein